MSIYYEEMKKLEERFWGNVNKSKTNNECWEWQGYLNKNDYGQCQFRIEGEKIHQRAHRVSYSLFYETNLASSDIVRHQCNNPPCVNPHHLQLGTHFDNVQDRVKSENSATGEENGRSKLTVDDVDVIRDKFNKLVKNLSNEKEVSEKCIRDICNDNIWIDN